MNRPVDYPSVRKRLLDRMPDDVADSFTDLQLQMLEHALDGGRWRQNHLVDIRLTVPFPWSQLYFVFLAGRDKRSPQRRSHERAKHPVMTAANVITYCLLVLLGVPAVIGLVQILQAP